MIMMIIIIIICLQQQQGREGVGADAKDKYVVWSIGVWVTRPERPKGAKDEVKMPEGQKVGPMGRKLEVGAQRAPSLLVLYIACIAEQNLSVCNLFIYWLRPRSRRAPLNSSPIILLFGPHRKLIFLNLNPPHLKFLLFKFNF